MTSKFPLIASVLAAAAIVPTAANAAHLGGQPSLRPVDAHHATLQIAADKMPSKVTFAGGQKVSGLHKTGRHGNDSVYTARVTSKTVLREGAKYTVRIRFGSASIERVVKLHD
jgi:hypothetical protein